MWGGMGLEVGNSLGGRVRWAEETGLVCRVFLFQAGRMGVDKSDWKDLL